MPKLPIHPNCKCHYINFTAEQLFAKEKKIKEIENRLIVNSKSEILKEEDEFIAKKKAEAAVIAGEMLHAEKKTKSPDTMFLYFNGRYLYSSDGNFIKAAAAGVPVKEEIKYKGRRSPTGMGAVSLKRRSLYLQTLAFLC